MLHVNTIMLHIEVIKSHANIFLLHVGTLMLHLGGRIMKALPYRFKNQMRVQNDLLKLGCANK